MKENVAYFEIIAEACIECGACIRVQEQSGCYEWDYASFARAMIDAIANDDFQDVTDPVWSCTLCGACTARCPARIRAYDFIYHARCVLNPKQPAIIDGFAPMRTDLDTNSFRQLRAVRKPLVDDALETAGTCETLLFTGCSLGTYAPKLSACVFEHLRNAGSVDGITYECCGNPLYFMGSPELLQNAAGTLSEKLRAHGTRELIVACPSCYAALCSYQENGLMDAPICITPLPVVLAEQGMAVDPQVVTAAGFDTVSLKDACRDRENGTFADSVRSILGLLDVIELKHNRRSSRCCGSGGLVPLYDEDTSDEKRWAILQEFDDAESSLLVTMCLSCSVALRQDGDTNIAHYLELLFDQPIDWDELAHDMARAQASGVAGTS